MKNGSSGHGPDFAAEAALNEPALNEAAPGELPRNEPLLLENLRALPGSFAFPQAVDIAERWLRSRAAKEAGNTGGTGGARGAGAGVNANSVRYKVNPALSFPPGDIAAFDIVERENLGPQANFTLNLMGLHGAGSPMPAYFTEYVAQHADEADALRDFFDIFNHRLVGLLHQTWAKYRYYAQYKPQASDRLSNHFFGFFGAGHKELRQAKDLRWPRLMAYVGLISFNSDSVGSLESILRHYFNHQAVHIQPCIMRWVAVPEEQRARLGEENCALGEDFVLGDEMPDQTGKFRICLSELTWEQFNSFLPSEEKFAELHTLVKFTLKSRLDFDVELRLLPEEVRPWKLDDASGLRLGWSSWATGLSVEEGDGAVII